MQQMEWREALDEVKREPRRARRWNSWRAKSAREYSAEPRASAHCWTPEIPGRRPGGAPADVPGSVFGRRRRHLRPFQRRTLRKISAERRLIGRSRTSMACRHNPFTVKNSTWLFCKFPNPGMSTAPHQHRLAVGIDLGTTNSLVATVRNGIPELLHDEEGRALLPSVVRYLPNGDARIGHEALASADSPIRATPSSRSSASWGAAWRTSHDAERLPVRLIQDAPGMVQLRPCAGVEKPGRGRRRNPRHLAPARRRCPGRRAGRRGGHGAGLFRRCPAPGDQGRRAARRPERAAPAQRADRGGDRLRPGQRVAKGIYAVYDLGGGTFDISILKLTQGRVRSAGHRRRLGARRRRLRPSLSTAGSLRAGAAWRRCRRSDDGSAVDAEGARSQGIAV